MSKREHWFLVCHVKQERNGLACPCACDNCEVPEPDPSLRWVRAHSPKEAYEKAGGSFDDFVFHPRTLENVWHYSAGGPGCEDARPGWCCHNDMRWATAAERARVRDDGAYPMEP